MFKKSLNASIPKTVSAIAIIGDAFSVVDESIRLFNNGMESEQELSEDLDFLEKTRVVLFDNEELDKQLLLFEWELKWESLQKKLDEIKNK